MKLISSSGSSSNKLSCLGEDTNKESIKLKTPSKLTKVASRLSVLAKCFTFSKVSVVMKFERCPSFAKFEIISGSWLAGIPCSVSLSCTLLMTILCISSYNALNLSIYRDIFHTISYHVDRKRERKVRFELKYKIIFIINIINLMVGAYQGSCSC